MPKVGAYSRAFFILWISILLNRGSGQCVLVIHITDDLFEFFDLLSVNSHSRSCFCKLYMSISSICCRNQKLRNTISMFKKPYAHEVLARGIFFSVKALKGIFIGFKDVWTFKSKISYQDVLQIDTGMNKHKETKLFLWIRTRIVF